MLAKRLPSLGMPPATSSAPAPILKIMLGAPRISRCVGQTINLIAGMADGPTVVWRSTLGSTTEMRWRSPLPTSRWPSLIILQAITGRRGCSSWRRIGSSGWGPLGRRDSTPEISCSVNKEGIGVQAINLKLPFDSPEFGFFSPLSLFTFHFSTHCGEEPIFGSLPLWSQRAFGLSHWRETTSVYHQFGKPWTISDIFFLI